MLSLLLVVLVGLNLYHCILLFKLSFTLLEELLVQLIEVNNFIVSEVRRVFEAEVLVLILHLCAHCMHQIE